MAANELIQKLHELPVDTLVAQAAALGEQQELILAVVARRRKQLEATDKADRILADMRNERAAQAQRR